MGLRCCPLFEVNFEDQEGKKTKVKTITSLTVDNALVVT